MIDEAVRRARTTDPLRPVIYSTCCKTGPRALVFRQDAVGRSSPAVVQCRLIAGYPIPSTQSHASQQYFWETISMGFGGLFRIPV